MTEFIVRNSMLLNATPDVVWDALTNPEKTKEYFFNCRVFSDWKQGGPITWKGTILLFKKIELHGKILGVEKGKLLKYELENHQHPDDAESTSTVTYTLKPEKGMTLLSVSDDVGNGTDAKERYDKSVKGWRKVLKGLKKVVEN
jgi:uncharacterized protein YndB with AHSA1/START domain